MTPNRSRIRWVIADPDTGAVIAPEFAIAIHLDRLTADQIDAATDASELDLIPADVLDESVSLAALLADGLRWRAWLATPYGNSPYTRGNAYTTPDEGVRCPSCELAENRTQYIDIRTAVVVPWDVMGDPRAYALVCPECAEVDRCNTCGGSGRWETTFENSPTTLTYLGACPECAKVTPEPAPNPAHVCDTCGTETPAIWWHYHATGDGTPDEGRKYCGPCWDNLPADEVNE